MLGEGSSLVVQEFVRKKSEDSISEVACKGQNNRDEKPFYGLKSSEAINAKAKLDPSMKQLLLENSLLCCHQLE